MTEHEPNAVPLPRPETPTVIHALGPTPGPFFTARTPGGEWTVNSEAKDAHGRPRFRIIVERASFEDIQRLRLMPELFEEGS